MLPYLAVVTTCLGVRDGGAPCHGRRRPPHELPIEVRINVIVGNIDCGLPSPNLCRRQGVSAESLRYCACLTHSLDASIDRRFHPKVALAACFCKLESSLGLQKLYTSSGRCPSTRTSTSQPS